MTINTIFLDRDGVINIEKNYLYKIEDFDFISDVFSACQSFVEKGYKIIIVTNQSGISRGYYSLKDYQILTNWMMNQFKINNIEILDVFHCPHSPNDRCSCRKPMPGMFLKAQKKYDINMKNSWVIGDKEDDITAAIESGIENTILVKSGHKIDKSRSKSKYFLESIYESTKVITS